MSEAKTKKSVGVAFAAIVTALLLAASCVTACIVSGSGSGDAAAKASLANAEKTVQKFIDDSARIESDFTDNLLKKGSSAVIMYQGKNDDGQLEKIANAAGADFIVITDIKGKAVQAYPDEKMVGKTLKENNLSAFGKITKSIVDKMISDPVKTDDGYKVNVGVRRQDADGVLILGFTDDSYAEVMGENLAEKCGNNVVICQGKELISTTFEPAKDCESAEAFEKKAKDAGNTFDGKKYDIAKGSVEDYTIFAATAQAGVNGNAVLIIIIANAVFIIIGVCLYLVGSKKK
ncbi:MAG TPA: hypothetical protein DEO32_06240 [Ruminococcaceae bacterium]|nr:hypothetical protein [Oscillospiraceae bacterium]